jgi:hypothetical protein
LINEIAPVYETVLQELSGNAFGKVTLSKRETVSNLMLSVEHQSLREMYHAIRHNEFQVENCGTLSGTEYFTFYDEMFDHLNSKVDNKDYEVGCKKLYASKTEDIRGVSVVQVTDELTRIYGAAHSLFWSPRDARTKPSLVHWRESPGLTLGAIMMTGLASRY